MIKPLKLLLAIAAWLLPAALIAANLSPVDYVDTRVGTANSCTKAAGLFGKKTEELGQTIPAVLAPNGMNFWTPQTRDTERKCVAPYYYADSLLQGFRNSHWIVGGCTQDYGSMTFMPLTGKLRTAPEERATRFSHTSERANPALYAVDLPDEGIHVELTATERCAMMRMVYANQGKAYLVVNPNSDDGDGFIAIDTLTSTIYGYNPVTRIYQGKGNPAGFSGHFIIQLDRKPTGYGVWRQSGELPGGRSAGFETGIGAWIEFDVAAGDTVLAKASSSFTGHEGAVANMEAELPGWDFDATHATLRTRWNDRLGRIAIDGASDEALRKFYGAFYRASFLPHAVNDVDGRYPSFATGYPIVTLDANTPAYYDGFSMWDTYRALHPFVNLMFPTDAGVMMQSLLLKGQQGGWLPIFPCWNSYTAAMIGDHCTAALADAFAKGIKGFDPDEAYRLARRNAFNHPSEGEYADGCGRRALRSYLKYGYIPVEDTVPYAYHRREQTSRTMEYAYDDFVLGRMARALGHNADADTLMARSANWRNVINPATGYADGRHADGRWTGDNPFTFSRHITEGAPCHYTWYVPHDPYGLMEAMGGRKAYVAKLDSLFSQRRYWHGNEPCHQVAFMYAYAGEPWKTAREVRHILDTEYLDLPGGLSGNDDAGQMSVWYIFASLGFYPVCPGTPYYIISAPSFARAELKLENGRTFTILAPKVSDRNIYVKSARLNGKPFDRAYLTHQEIMDGGVLEFDMTNRPGCRWATKTSSLPPAVTR